MCVCVYLCTYESWGRVPAKLHVLIDEQAVVVFAHAKSSFSSLSRSLFLYLFPP